MQTLEGRIAVVTGAASGIGNALATRLASEGMAVVLADIEQTALDGAVETLRASGASAVGHLTDVSSADSVSALAERAFDEFGGVHLLCNNAGVLTGGACWEAPVSDWDWVLGVNLYGVVHGIRSFVPRLLEQDGASHIVNTASMAGLTSMPYSSVYCVSKHACLALSECLYHEMQAAGGKVGVSVLCPEVIATRINRSERNRQSGYKRGDDAAPTGEEAVLAGLEQFIATGLPPAEMADRVVDAVLNDRFYILSDPADVWSQMATARLDAIRDRVNPSFSMGS